MTKRDGLVQTEERTLCPGVPETHTSELKETPERLRDLLGFQDGTGETPVDGSVELQGAAKELAADPKRRPNNQHQKNV